MKVECNIINLWDAAEGETYVYIRKEKALKLKI